MKRLASMTAAALAVLLTGCVNLTPVQEQSAPEESDQPQELSNTGEIVQNTEPLDQRLENGIASLSYPSSWAVVQDTDSMAQVVAPEAKATAIIGTSDLETQFQETAADVVLREAAEGFAEAAGGTARNERECSIDGIDGLRFETQFIVDEIAYETNCVIFAHEDILYVCAVGHAAKEYEALAGDILASLRLSPDTAPGAGEPAPAPEPEPEPEPAHEPKAEEPKTTVSQDNALRTAKDYLSFMAFSHEGLVDQLEYEGFSNEDAVWAADNCGADWMEQAEKSAESYLDLMGFSRSELIDQLVYEGFTQEQAEHGADSVGL